MPSGVYSTVREEGRAPGGGHWVDSRRLSGCPPAATEVWPDGPAEPFTGRRPILLASERRKLSRNFSA